MGNDEAAMRAVQQWLSMNPDLDKPALPTARGLLTIKHVHGLVDPIEYGAAVQEWARSAWNAYFDLHLIAREWLSRSRSTDLRRNKS
jgi:hypothetical protein